MSVQRRPQKTLTAYEIGRLVREIPERDDVPCPRLRIAAHTVTVAWRRRGADRRVAVVVASPAHGAGSNVVSVECAETGRPTAVAVVTRNPIRYIRAALDWLMAEEVER